MNGNKLTGRSCEGADFSLLSSKVSRTLTPMSLIWLLLIKNVIMTEWVDLPRHDFFAFFFWFLFSITILGYRLSIKVKWTLVIF